MAKNVKITYNDNSAEVLNRFQKAVRNGLVAIGLTAETKAKKNITKNKSVDTGRLRNSITYAIAGEKPHVNTYKANKKSSGKKKLTTYSYDGIAEGKKNSAVYIGTNVEYAPFVENGSRNNTPKPFLKPAATEHAEEYKKIMTEAMKNA